MRHRTKIFVGFVTAAAVSAPAWVGALLHPTAALHRAHFHFDGTLLEDVSSVTATFAGGAVPTYVAGRYGSGIQFDGVDDTVSLADAAALDWDAVAANVDNDRIVVEAWIKPMAAGGTILSKGCAGGADNYRLSLGANRELIFRYESANGTQRVFAGPMAADGSAGTLSGGPLTLDEWHFVGVNLSRNTMQMTGWMEMRVDGGVTDVTTASIGGGAAATKDAVSNAAALSIGSCNGTAGTFFNGVIDDVRVSIQPDATTSFPSVASDRGTILYRAEFNPPSGDDFFEVFRADLGDGAAAVSLSGMQMEDEDLNVYQVPAGAGHEISPGEFVRVYLNGTPLAGGPPDTTSTTFSEWYTRNGFLCPGCTLGGGAAGQRLENPDSLRMTTTGLPDDPDSAGIAGRPGDAVAWGAASLLISNFVVAQGLWPAAAQFIAIGTENGIRRSGDASTTENTGSGAWTAITTTWSGPSLSARWEEREGSVRVEWQTWDESYVAGFRVLRALEASGPREILTADPIPPAAEISGTTYEWIDGGVARNTTYYFFLEEIGVDGSSRVTGPVEVETLDAPAGGCNARIRT